MSTDMTPKRRKSMMTQNYQQLIIEGIKGLPPETLAEIADFIFFLRKRTFQPQAFKEEIQHSLLNAELRQLSRDEAAHLEKEFDDYESHYRCNWS
jgi:hypothetical protein